MRAIVTITVTGDTANSGAAFQTNLGSFILNSVSGDSTFTRRRQSYPPPTISKYHPDIRTPGEIAKTAAKMMRDKDTGDSRDGMRVVGEATNQAEAFQAAQRPHRIFLFSTWIYGRRMDWISCPS